MKYEEIIAMARECGCPVCSYPDEIVRFAALVAAKERARLSSDVEMPEPTFGDLLERRYTADQLRDYGDRRAAAEREAIAVRAEQTVWAGKEFATAIRARGQQ